jgi:hypothetical protein
VTSLSIVPCLARRAFDVDEVEGRFDQREVGEGLREVADLLARVPVPLLGEEADVVAQVEELLEQPARVAAAALQEVVVDEPGRAGEEGALLPREAVDAFSVSQRSTSRRASARARPPRRLRARLSRAAVDVDLELSVRVVADADRPGAAIAGQPVELGLVAAMLARDAIKRLQLGGRARHRAQEPFGPPSAS